MTANAEDLQRRWRGVASHFPLWRFLIDLVFDPSSWQMVGADITTLVMKSKNARRAVQVLEGASAEILDALATVARVNEQRSNDIFRPVFLGYVSIPIALAAMLSDAAPDMLSTLVREYTPSIVILLVGALVFPILYFCGNWRAKQILWVIELYRAGAVTPFAE